ncbi:calcium-activated chloride channel regulator 1-like [Latimeria chalumnae]|uniref:calcium-activated chloride channel regulator 1-like n=1 Tax=Latimeria chalumnae TaxID=7897 RepID=UPI00313E3C7C
MVTDASPYLFRATRNRAFYRDVKILLPKNWTSNPELYKKAERERFAKAHVQIDVPSPTDHVKDNPYVLTKAQCGEQGNFIHFTPDYLLKEEISSPHGPKGRVFVHEWSHFRWGVFDEYPVRPEQKFYISVAGEPEATRCSKNILGKLCYSGNQQGCLPCKLNERTGLPTSQCNFFLSQEQSTTASIMFKQDFSPIIDFCDKTNHNLEAPNNHNKICNHKSTWEVISQTQDFKNRNHPTSVTPPTPTFTLLQAKERVVCLVLDTSGSMSGSSRILRLRQAAELFLLQIIEGKALVGIVTFSSSAIIKKTLTVITDDSVRTNLVNYLPSTASGGTDICSGVHDGFQVLRGDDGQMSGDEIILMTDGEDSKIGSCFDDVRRSGSIIHTIALGPSAAKELETLVTLTGGERFYAGDSLDSNGLIDTFSATTSSSGEFVGMSLQLASTGEHCALSTWFNNSVFIDSTVGNKTVFFVTWEHALPDIWVYSPTGNVYTNAHMLITVEVKKAQLSIPGVAKPGAWNYSIYNKNSKNQVFTVTVLSQATDESVPPITIRAEMNKDSNTYPEPMAVYVAVFQGSNIVTQANVIAVIDRADGSKVELVLSDSGLGADGLKDDGVYSGFYYKFSGNGRYSLKVKAEGIEGTAKISMRAQGIAPYIAAYVDETGTIHSPKLNLGMDENEISTSTDSFSRITTGGSFTVSNVPPVPTDDFSPARVTDLTAAIVDQEFQLSWTAPGDDLDQGTVSSYEIRVSHTLKTLRDNFMDANIVNSTRLSLQPAGSVEVFNFILSNFTIVNGTVMYFAIRARDDVGNVAKISNIAPASYIILPKADLPTSAVTTTTVGSSSESVKPSYIAVTLLSALLLLLFTA